MSSHVSAAYKKRPATLWVEDDVARSYLVRIWQDSDSDIDVAAAGSAGGVRELVQAAGLRNVFGYVGRGFDTDASGRLGWLRPGAPRVLVSGAFGPDTFLLDEDAIVGSVLNTSGKSAQAIAAEMQALAAPLTWWMACRSVIAALSRKVRDRFIPPPGLDVVQDRPSALAWLATSSWVISTAPGVPALVTPDALEELLVAEEERLARTLRDSRWKTELPAREILRQLLPRVWTRMPAGTRLRDAMCDLAKAVADQQRRLSIMPEEIQELRETLRIRLGLPR